ncbi:MAG: hypothetical protein JWR50_3106 [Mucilaginibacter sp.]|nr:hypothetical protein [Mucilaginibacter sp.]
MLRKFTAERDYVMTIRNFPIMVKKEDIKAFKAPVDTIKLISRTGWGMLINTPFIGVKARLRKAGKKFILNWTCPYLPENIEKKQNGYYNLLLNFSGYSLVLEDVLAVSDLSFQFPKVKKTEQIDYFHTDGFDKKANYFFRLIIPLEEKLEFFFQLERKTFEDDFGWRHARGTQVVINGDLLQVCVFHDEKQINYLSIESYKKQPYELFSDKAHAVINGLGLLTGYLAGNSGWYFAYLNKEMSVPSHFYRNPMRDTMISSYTPVNINPHAWIHDRTEADRLYKLDFLKPVSFEVFSNLCQKLFDSVDFSAAILLMMEASVASLIFRPGGYAIVLESLADLITGEAKACAPMDKSLARNVRDKLKGVINAECAHLSQENRDILIGKINNINQITNKSRLRIPFNEFKIPLSKKDLELLDTRNDFLHGRIPDLTEAGVQRSIDRKNKDLYYASVRFYTLICRLILAWVGYDNYVLNHAKIQENFTHIFLTDEEYYLATIPSN